MLDPGTITRLLGEADQGRAEATDELIRHVYADLERIAAKHMRRCFGPDLNGVTLEPAALVNEAFFRLSDQRKGFRHRAQFFAIATKVLLRVLIDYQRARRAGKRGGDQVRVTLSGLNEPAAPDPLADIEALDELLEELDQLDSRKAQVVKLRILWGFSMPEISETLQVALATVERDWSFAKRWLSARIETGAA